MFEEERTKEKELICVKHDDGQIWPDIAQVREI